MEAVKLALMTVNCWNSSAHALEYLSRADSVPHRTEGEAALLDCLPSAVTRALDLGSGDGRLLGLVRLVHPNAEGVALDFSATMLTRLRERFADVTAVKVVEHDLEQPLPVSLGMCDAVVSSFAIHHLAHQRKQALYTEVFEHLRPGGVFCNLEHVASPTAGLHERFLDALGMQPDEEDLSNQLLDVETQLGWLKGIGFDDVDCQWKWRELALLAGVRPSTT